MLTETEKEMILAIRNCSNPDDLMQKAFQFIYDYYHSLESDSADSPSEDQEAS